MSRLCPSCEQPLQEDHTLDQTAYCTNCGHTFNDPGPTRTVIYQPAQIETGVAHFELKRRLGGGGFGDVWLAWDRHLDREVALKLPKGIDQDSGLLREARTAAKLKHPNIVAVYEIGVDNGQIFIASEFIDGEDLKSELARGRPDVDRSVYLIACIAQAADHAHQHGIVHRDFKPANVILNSKGEPFVTDFGIAKQLSVDETISSEGSIIGTVSYMSPEQALGMTKETDHRADIYAIGVMLYELLTEYRPFRGTPQAVIHQKSHDDPPSPRKLVPSLARDLETICLKCIERDPARRYQKAAELADELHRYQQGVPIKARPISRLEKGWRWCKRNPLVASLVSGIISSLTVGLLLVNYFWGQAVHNAEISRLALYRTSMNLAGTLWDNGDVNGLDQTLSVYDTDGASRDLADFSWHYFATMRKPFVQVANHGEVVTDVAVSPDGRVFASAGTDQLIRVWNSETGDLIRTLEPQGGKIGAIEFSPNDDRLASAHSDGEVRLWNPLQHDHVLREYQHGAGLTHVRFSPSGELLLSASTRGVVRLWQVSSGEQLDDLTQMSSGVRDIRFSLNGDQIGIALQNGIISLWSVPDHEFIGSPLRVPQVLCFDFVDEDNTIVAGTLTSALRMISPVDGEFVRAGKADGGAIGDLQFLSQGKLLAMVTSDYKLFVMDLQLQETRHLPTHTLSLGILGESHDGRFLAVGSGDGSIKLLSVEALQRPDVLWHDSHVRAVNFLSDGERFVYCAGDGAVQLCDLQTGKQQELLAPSEREMLSLAVQPGTNLIATAGMSRELLILSADDPEIHERVPLTFAGVSSVRFSHDGRFLATGGRNGAVQVYDFANRTKSQQTAVSPPLTPAADVPALNAIAAGDHSPREPKFEIGHPDIMVNDLAFSPISGVLTVALSDGRIEFINPAEGTVEDRHLQLTSIPTALVYCEGGRQLAVGTQTGEIELFQMPTGTPIRTIKCHGSRINALTVFPGGTTIASAGRERNIHIWDTVSGERISTLRGHRRQIFSITMSSDGSHLVSAGLEGDIRIWRSTP